MLQRRKRKRKRNALQRKEEKEKETRCKEEEEETRCKRRRKRKRAAKKRASKIQQSVKKSLGGQAAAPGSATTKNQRTRRAKAPTPKVLLEGTGASYGLDTRWGIVEAVAPDVAARVRQLIDGTESIFDQSVTFEETGIELTGSSALVLTALADFLKGSESIMLVMLEGYSTALSDPTENQRLSQARASVVREFLIGKGISADRLISYGLGQRRPSTHSEALLIRLISGQPANRPAAKKWDKVALVEVSGDVSIRHQEQAGVAALPARPRNEFEAPFVIETSAKSQALLRFPDSSRLQLHPTSQLHLETARYSSSPRALTLRLSRGGLVVMNDPTLASGIPLEIKVGNIVVSGGALALRAESRDEHARVSVDQGMATVRTPSG